MKNYSDEKLELVDLWVAMQDIGVGSNPPQPGDRAFVIKEGIGTSNEHFHIQFMDR